MMIKAIVTRLIWCLSAPEARELAMYQLQHLHAANHAPHAKRSHDSKVDDIKGQGMTQFWAETEHGSAQCGFIAATITYLELNMRPTTLEMVVL